MRQYRVEILTAFVDDRRQADDLRARAYDDKKLQLSVILKWCHINLFFSISHWVIYIVEYMNYHKFKIRNVDELYLFDEVENNINIDSNTKKIISDYLKMQKEYLFN